MNALGRGALAALGVEVRTHGLEHLPRTGPVLLASTHGSFTDFVVLEKAAIQRGRYVRFLTRYDAWVPPLVSRAMDAMQHVPVDRAAPAGAYLTARRLLLRGEALGVFPEAGISHAFTVRALMRGTAALARETGVPVLPVALWGGQRIWSVGDPKPAPDLTRGRVVDVRFGAPMHVSPGDDVSTCTAQLGQTLTDLLEHLQLLPEHRPRPGEYAEWYPAHLGGRAPGVERGRILDELPLNALPPTWGPHSPTPAGAVPGPAR